MKRLKILTIFLVLFGLGACKDDYLQIENPNAKTSGTFWKNDNDLKSGLTACYSTLYYQGTYRQWYDIVYEMRSDLGWNESGWRDYANFSKFKYPSYNWETISYVWDHHFRAIYHVNEVLTYGVPIQMDEKLKQRYFSEAKFLRALFYYNLILAYGRPPIVLEPQSGKEMPSNKEADHQEKVWAQVEKDLTESIDGLKAYFTSMNKDIWSVPDGEAGRATLGAYYALLGKAYMQQHKWQAATDAFTEIIKSKNYELTDEFNDNFRLENENNKESIFEIQYNDQSTGDWGDYNTVKSPMSSQRAIYYAPRTDAQGVSIGGNDDIKPNFFFWSEFNDKTSDGTIDPRRDKTIMWSTKQTLYGRNILALGGSPKVAKNYPVIFMIKGSNGYYRNYETNYSAINNRVIRYADILLLNAEALNELDRTSEAYKFIDEVRQRPSVMVVKLSVAKPNLTKDEMSQQIQHERIVELGGESQRWADLLRWGLLDTEEGKTILLQHDYEFQNFRPGIDKYLPIPQVELDCNQNLSQNYKL